MWFCILLLLEIGYVEGNAPNIDYSHNMRVLKLPRETPVGTLIYRLKGSDADSDLLKFGARDSVGQELFEFQQVPFNQADVLLKKSLTEEEYTISIFVTDGAETTEVESTILVTNGTGLPHPFVDYITLLRVPENTKLNTSIGFVTAKERENSNLPVTFELRGSEKFKIRYEFGPRGTSKAVIQLIESLDYETRNLYELDVIALNAWTDERYDTRNVAVLPVAVVAQDVPDTPPSFKNVPAMVTVSDSAPPGTSVLNLTAEDGDYGNPRNLSYRLDKENPWSSHFSVNPTTGEVKTTRPLSELADKYGGTAVYILKVAVKETSGTVDYPSQEATTQFAVVLMSQENHAPSFGSEVYLGYVAENSAHLTAIDWAPGLLPKVYDRDQGRNSTFRLFLEGDEDGTFSVHPTSASREADFAILVGDSSKLDYEVIEPKYVEFKLVAAETEAVEPLTSTVTVRVNIVDTNDNPPMFTRDVYDAVVAEDAKKGTVVTTVTATDPDSGNFGKVRYTSINGPISRNLNLNPETGEVTLKSSEGLDRESVPEYMLTVEAHDDDGQGLRATAQLRIQVGDANDNAPAFTQPRYDAVLTADLADFAEPLYVKATDADAPGPNSNVTYEIVSGNYEQKFRINPETGHVTLTAPLTSLGKRGSPVTLTVRAHDQGIPVLSVSVPVRVHTQEYLNRSIVVVLPGDEAQVKPRKERIEKGLSDLLGANVNIYSVMPHNQSKNATTVRAWAVYESQPIDLVSFERIMSNLYGKDYGQLSKEKDVVKTSGNDRIFWIFIIVLILLILLILLIMLCCCWRYLLRNQRPRSSSKVAPETTSVEQSFREGPGGSLDKAAANGSIPNGRARLGGHIIGASGVVSKSVAVGTHSVLEDRDGRRGGTEQNPRGRVGTPEGQFMLHEISREPPERRGNRQAGNYLLVRRDAARRHRDGERDNGDTDYEEDRYRRRSAVSDSFGTSRSCEYSGGSLGVVGGGPRRTEILYIRSPPPGEVDVSAYADQGSQARHLKEDPGDPGLRPHRRENARRVRFSRYHKVDGGSFVLPLSSDDTSVLPKDQAWIVPREQKQKQDHVGMVNYEEPGRRTAHEAHLRPIQDSGEDSQDAETSDGGELYDDAYETRSKNIVANDPSQVHGGEASGPLSLTARQNRVTRVSRARRQKIPFDAPEAQLRGPVYDEGGNLVAGEQSDVIENIEGDKLWNQSDKMARDKNTQGSHPATSLFEPVAEHIGTQQTASHGSVNATSSLHQNMPVTYQDGVASKKQGTTQYSSDTAFNQTVPQRINEALVKSGVPDQKPQQPQVGIQGPSIQGTNFQYSDIQLQGENTDPSLGPPRHQLLTITGMSPVFFGTAFPQASLISHSGQPTMSSAVGTAGYSQTLLTMPKTDTPVHVTTPGTVQQQVQQDLQDVSSRENSRGVPAHAQSSNLREGKDISVGQHHLIIPVDSYYPLPIPHATVGPPFSTGTLVDKATLEPGTTVQPGGEHAIGILPDENVEQKKYKDVHNLSSTSKPDTQEQNVSLRSSLKPGAQTLSSPSHDRDSELTPSHRNVSTVTISTKVLTRNADVVQEEGTAHMGAVSDSEFETVEHDFKSTFEKPDGSEHDGSDSGIGPGTSNLRLKKNAFIEKKSLFTIAYNGVNTQRLRTSLGSSSSPSP